MSSAKIKKCPSPLMYVWSLLYGCNSLGHGCNFLCVKFLICLHLGHLFTYSSISLLYPGHHTSSVMLFFMQPPFHHVCRHVHSLLSSFFVFLEVLPYCLCKLLPSLMSFCVKPLCRLSTSCFFFSACRKAPQHVSTKSGSSRANMHPVGDTLVLICHCEPLAIITDKLSLHS